MVFEFCLLRFICGPSSKKKRIAVYRICRFACDFDCVRMSSTVTAKFTKLFYGNDWHDAKSGKVFPAVNPADGSKICDVAEADSDDVKIAVDFAKKAFQIGAPWRSFDARDAKYSENVKFCPPIDEKWTKILKGKFELGRRFQCIK